jgi:hypothetical protein
MLKAQILPSRSASNTRFRSSNFFSSTSRRFASSWLFPWAIGSWSAAAFLILAMSLSAFYSTP